MGRISSLKIFIFHCAQGCCLRPIARHSGRGGCRDGSQVPAAEDHHARPRCSPIGFGIIFRKCTSAPCFSIRWNTLPWLWYLWQTFMCTLSCSVYIPSVSQKDTTCIAMQRSIPPLFNLFRLLVICAAMCASCIRLLVLLVVSSSLVPPLERCSCQSRFSSSS